MDVFKRDKPIEPAVEGGKQSISGLILLLEAYPNSGKSATLQKFPGRLIREFGANSVSPSISISGYCRKKFPQTDKHPEIIRQERLSAIESCFSYAPAGAEWHAPGNARGGEDHGFIDFADSPRFRELHAEVEVFSRLPAGRKTVGADVTGSSKAEAGANSVKRVR